MRILIANTFHYYRGGDCVYAFSLSELLRQVGNHEVINFAMKHPFNLPSRYSEFFVSEIDLIEEMKKNKIRSGFKVLRKTIYSTESKKKLEELLKKYPVDIAHINTIHGHITPSIFHTLKARNIPIVWTLHDYFLLCPNTTFYSGDRVCEKCKDGKFYNVIINKCRKKSFAASFMVMLEEYIHRLMGFLNITDFFVVPSNFLREKLIEYGFPPKKVVHIPYLIDCKKFKISLTNNGYILYSGRLSYEKGIETLIKAVSLCKDIKLLIAGDGPIRLKLEDLTKNFIPDKVEFLGYLDRESLKKIIKGAMFVVVPSQWYENFPYSILESFAFGKPVVGSNIGGIPELVKEGETGLLFEPGNSVELAEKISYLVNNTGKIKEMGLQAKKLVEKTCNSEMHYKKVLEVYEKALKKHGC
jgi:glycosyltransferase involved in cell wall biosynthesis